MGPKGSSPHTRGARVGRFLADEDAGIIPAYAGSTAAAPPVPTIYRDHPRIRGEHDVYDMVTARGRGSSPHTRGARHAADKCDAIHRIIPAYAGSTALQLDVWTTYWDHPRIRGEHLRCCARRCVIAGSSPHTRGAHRPARSRGHHERIIPAYAGSTCCTL